MFQNTVITQLLSEKIKANRLPANGVFILLYAAFFFFGIWLGSQNSGLTPIWPASGLAIAAVFIAKRALIPGVLLGSFLCNALTGLGIAASLSTGIGSALEAYVAYTLLAPARKLSDLLGDYALPAWITLSAIFAPIIAATLGVFGECFLTSYATEVWRDDLWRVWWLSSTIGILLVTPCFLLLEKPGKLSISFALRSMAFVAITIVTCAILHQNQGNPTYLFMGLPLLFIACIWFGPTGATATNLFFSVFVFLIYLYSGQQSNNVSRLVDEIILLDIFLLVLSISALALTVFYKKDRFLIPGVILMCGWFLSAWVYQSLHNASMRVDDLSFQELIDDSKNSISTRYGNYSDALRAGAAFYMESDNVSREEWRKFVQYLDLNHRYPGISGLGIVLPIKDEALPSYTSDTQAGGLVDFTVKNLQSNTEGYYDRLGYSHYIVDRIEPLELNQATLGMDLATDEIWASAAVKARDNGMAAISDNIQLSNNHQKFSGFLLYMPMYKQDMPLETIDQRRDAFVAWTFAPFITDAFFQGILIQKARKLDFAVFESHQLDLNKLIYKTDEHWSPLDGLDYESLTRIELGQRTYSFVWKKGPDFNRSEVYSASIAGASVALGTCFLSGIVIGLLTTNRSANRIVETRTSELRELNDNLLLEIQVRKQAEETADAARRAAEAANLAKSEFLATMSHEIRTPMNSVLGFCELLNSSPLNSEQRLWANYIQGSGQSLLAIINDILDFSKIEGGKMELEQMPYDVRQATEEVASNFRVSANEKGLNLDYIADPKIPERVIGDPTRYKQIVSNLIGNAVKFTDKGVTTVSIKWEEAAPDKGLLVLDVTDTGVGIEADKLEKLFQKFSQVDSSTTRKYGGTGLGLAISKTLTELMGGTIKAESKIGNGTTLTIRIPYKVANDIENIEKSITEFKLQPQKRNNFGAEILLVDDNKVNQKLGMTVLKRLGCKITIANNGREAVQAVKTKDFSVIFMDCRMPSMDGFEATRQIRKLESEGTAKSDKPGKPLPVLALTANVTASNKQECLDAGMNDLLQKPCKVDDFITALENFWVENKDQA